MSTIEKALGRLRKDREAVQPTPHRRDGDEPVSFEKPTAPLDLSGKESVTIDPHMLRKHGVQPPAHLENTLRDEYRRIKRPLIANAFGRGVPQLDHGNVIMVTSALAGEGKTFTSINLALSIARDPEISVIFVDGDVARASASNIFGIQGKPGLIDVLSDRNLTVNDVMLPTSIDSLFLISAGKKHSHSEELLSGTRMEQVVASLAAQKNTIIIFDSPPILRTPEATTLCASAGQIVVVVKALSTRKHQITEAIDQLDPNKAINLILNQSLSGPGGDEYGGYYGGYYGDADRE